MSVLVVDFGASGLGATGYRRYLAVTRSANVGGPTVNVGFGVEPCRLPATQRTAAIGASSSLPPIPAKVASPNRQRSLRLGGWNWSSCPLCDIRDHTVEPSDRVVFL